MSFIKLVHDLDERYKFQEFDEKIGILGLFLTSDFNCLQSSFGQWASNPSWGDSVSGNITLLEREDNCIIISSLYSEEDETIALKIPVGQFIKILDEWKEKVCKLKPQEVTITEVNGEFVFETK